MTIHEWISLLNVTALVTIMLAMGLKVKVEEVLASARSGRLVLGGLLANYVLVPAVTLGLLFLFQTEPMISTGFFILAVCPGAPVGPPLAGLAKGNVALAIGLMAILAGLSALLSPALLTLLLTWVAPGRDVQIDYLAIVKILLVIQMLPLALGLVIHHKAPKLAQTFARPVGLLANSCAAGRAWPCFFWPAWASAGCPGDVMSRAGARWRRPPHRAMPPWAW
jgi:BASS family bile acid:Na+ symporter